MNLPVTTSERESRAPALNSVYNALRVLDYLVENEEGGVSEMGRQLGLSPGAVYRLVSTLVVAGFADQNAETRRYVPGPKILRLATAMRSRIEFLDLAHVHLRRLMERAHETVNFGVLRGDLVVYVDRVLSREPLGVEVKIGSHVPAYCTALGKAILAFSDDSVRDAYFGRYSDQPDAQQFPTSSVTPRRPTAAALLKELSGIAKQGYAEDLGDYSPEIMCIAAPVLNSRGKPIAAISISAPATRFVAGRESFVPMIGIASRELTLLVREVGDDNPPL